MVREWGHANHNYLSPHSLWVNKSLIVYNLRMIEMEWI